MTHSEAPLRHRRFSVSTDSSHHHAHLTASCQLHAFTVAKQRNGEKRTTVRLTTMSSAVLIDHFPALLQFALLQTVVHRNWQQSSS